MIIRLSALLHRCKLYNFTRRWRSGALGQSNQHFSNTATSAVLTVPHQVAGMVVDGIGECSRDECPKEACLDPTVHATSKTEGLYG
jgi:hypothetical protein